jgi:hypothetical protein
MNLLEGLQKLLGGVGAGAPVRGSKNRGIGGRRPGPSQMDRRFQQVNQSMPFAQRLQARPSGRMQPFGVGYEDEYTPAAALERTGYINPQTTQHSLFIQPGVQPRSGLQVGYGGGNPQTRSNPHQLTALRRLLGY